MESKSAVIVVIAGKEATSAAVSAALTSFYQVVAFPELTRASDRIAKLRPCAILVDEFVPPAGGLTVISQLRSDHRFDGLPIICMVDLNRLPGDPRHIGADEILAKPFRRSQMVRMVSGLVSRAVEARWEALPEGPREGLKRTVELFNGVSDLIDKGEPLAYSAVQDACTPLIESVQNHDFQHILGGVKGHDNYSYVHSLRVGTILSLFGYNMGLRGDDLCMLASGGLVHDIGKMFIPFEVLNKPGKLDETEMTVMRSHVDRTIGYLKTCGTMPRGVSVIAAQHHEKLNGKGYPKGLSDLNELARMAAIADVFGALTDRRCYKPPMEPEEALKLMSGPMQDELDQSLLGLFREMLLDTAREHA